MLHYTCIMSIMSNISIHRGKRGTVSGDNKLLYEHKYKFMPLYIPWYIVVTMYSGVTL